MVDALTDTFAFFPPAVRFAVSMFNIEIEELWKIQAHSPNGNPPTQSLDDKSLLAKKDDDERYEILGRLSSEHFIQFGKWTPEEIEIFVRLTFPLDLLAARVRNGYFPAYLHRLHDMWNPPFHYWVTFLWNFTCHACELFADVLYLLPSEQHPPPQVLGQALFVDLIDANVYSEYTAVSIIGAVLPIPTELSCAQEHARFIMSLAPTLTPSQTGFVIRNVLLHFARPASCPCGYEPGQSYCQCLFPRDAENIDVRGNATSPINTDIPIVRDDGTRIYATILLNVVLTSLQASYKEQNERHWDDHCRDILIASACDVIFSETAYSIIYKAALLNLIYVNNPVPSSGANEVPEPARPLARPRPLTADERQTNGFREHDDADNATLQTGKCIEPTCKQMRKPDCVNVACKTHCTECGVLNCVPHRFFPKKSRIADIQPRKNVTPQSFHQRYYWKKRQSEETSKAFSDSVPIFVDAGDVVKESRSELIARDDSEI